MPADPTMDLIRSLDDPTRFVRKDRVAVFKPHRRKFPDGTEVVVTAEDLAEIAANVNRTYEQDGELVKLTIGHRKQAPDADETKQPPVVGYAKDLRAELVDRPGGKVLRLTHTEYVRREYEAEAGRHPGRSPEYDPAAKTITAVALLTRDPALALGTVGYERGGRRLYQMETEMPNDAAPTVDGQPDEDAGYKTFCKYMQMYMASMGGANGGLPATTPDLPPVPYQKDTTPVSTPAIDPTVKALQDQVAALTRANVETASKRLLDPLTQAVKFDYARELSLLVSYQKDEDRTAHVNYMLANYEKLPTGTAMLPIAGEGASPAAKADPNDPAAAPVSYNAILTYMRSAGCSYEAAETHVLGQK